MELRLDRLLERLLADPTSVLTAIDDDPLLVKRESGDLVLANASQELYTPEHEHQLYAKGIVYRRAPYRLVSLPLIKIYNLGEREVSVGDLSELLDEPDVRLHFLRKYDGSLLQVFFDGGRLYFTTRGMIEGASPKTGALAAAHNSFDFLATARRMFEESGSILATEPERLGKKTLLFEMIHPDAPKITNYGEQEELVLLTCFDNEKCVYLTHDSIRSLADEFGLRLVDALEPGGESIEEQIGSMLESLEGTDEEGSVLTFEQRDRVIYRIKVKSPDYLVLLRAMSRCTYSRTVEILQEHPELTTWASLEEFLLGQGREEVPEEMLPFYQQHYESYRRFVQACSDYRDEILVRYERLGLSMEGLEKGSPEYRKEFAARVQNRRYSGLLFAALDARLDLDRVCRYCGSLQDAEEKLREIRNEEPPS